MIPMDGWFLVLKDQRGRGDGSSDRTWEEETEKKYEYRDTVELEHGHGQHDRGGGF